MYYTPKNLRYFLRSFLIKYEITNIKQLILGTILKMTSEEKYALVNELAEEYLNNVEFIKKLSEINLFEEIQLYMSRTRYNRAIREGILYLKRTNEIFVLESFLDQLYYELLNKELKNLNKKEKEIIEPYVKYKIELYNLNMIHRGLINKIDKTLLAQFLVNSDFILKKDNLNSLLQLENEEKFIPYLNLIYKEVKDLKGTFKPFNINEKHLISKIEKMFIKSYFKKFKLKIDDIEYISIFKIMEVLIKKDKEIRFKIIPRAVKIINKKFNRIKENLKTVKFKLED